MTPAQAKFQSIQRSQSEKRSAFNAINALPTPTDDQAVERDKLNGELSGLETEFRSALDAVEAEQLRETRAADDGEGRELRALSARANVGHVLTAAIEKRSAVDGAMGELQAHHKLAPNQIPLDALRLPELRAVTTSPANAQAQQAETVQPVFATGAGAFLGIFRPTVSMGAAVWPVLTSRPTVHGPYAAVDTDAANTTGAFDADLLAPERIQASFLYRRTDAARFSDMDMSLRMALNEGLQEKIDREAIRGDEGLLEGTNLANHARATSTDFAAFVSQFAYSRVDGRFAATVADVRSIMGSTSYAHAGSTYQAQPHYSALKTIMGESGGVRVSAHVPAASGNKQNAVIRLGMRRDMVQPMWAGVTVIVDEVTKSGEGQIEITAVLLMNTKIIRAAGFYKQEVNNS